MTADLSTLTDDALTRRLAELCGWHESYGHAIQLTSSVDALLAPGGPIARCRERGWRVVVETTGETLPGMEWLAQVWQYSRRTPGTTEAFGTAYAATAARALAEACCAALEATE